MTQLCIVKVSATTVICAGLTLILYGSVMQLLFSKIHFCLYFKCDVFEEQFCPLILQWDRAHCGSRQEVSSSYFGVITDVFQCCAQLMDLHGVV